MWNQEAKKTNTPASPQFVPAAEPKTPPDRRTAAYIGKSISIKGNVTSDEDLRIDGSLEGTIEVGGHSLTVRAGATIFANLTARTIHISGAVTGNITATERIQIGETGSVDGNLTAPRLALREGGTIRGRIDTMTEAPAKKLEQILAFAV